MSDQSVRITLVRHGESVANVARRWQGHGDSPLSELGRAQAAALAARLAGRRFARVVTSDLERACATARALLRPFECDPGFREFDVGAWEGLTREQVAVRFADELARLDAGEDLPLGGGESYGAFVARVDAAMDRLRAELAPGERALVICHGGVIGALVAAALGLRGARDLPLARVFNTAVSELSYEPDGRVRMCVFNDVLHLGELGPLPHASEAPSSLGLICELAPHARFGVYDAHYDFDAAQGSRAWDATLLAQGISVDPNVGASVRLDDLWRQVQRRHPASRVALTASEALIQAWAAQALWCAPPQRELTPPARGSACHIIARDGRLVVFDYGVAP